MGGGSLKETVLWTNSAPTSAFSAQNITLSQSIDNYKYLKITVNYNYQTPNTTCDFYIAVSDFKNMTGYGTFMFTASLMHTNGELYFRPFIYVSNTVIYAYNSYYNGLTPQAAAVIPTKICGLK